MDKYDGMPIIPDQWFPVNEVRPVPRKVMGTPAKRREIDPDLPLYLAVEKVGHHGHLVRSILSQYIAACTDGKAAKVELFETQMRAWVAGRSEEEVRAALFDEGLTKLSLRGEW